MNYQRSRTRPGLIPVFLILATILSVTGIASAYQRTVSSAGVEIYWPSSCFQYSIHEDGYSLVDFNVVQDIMQAGFGAWEDVPCSFFYFEETAPASVTRVEFDQTRGNVNLLIFREGDYQWPEDKDVLALTSVTFEPSTGVIYDADIEFNATGANQFGTVDDYTDIPHLFDLQSTATHEIGHMMGLDHEMSVPQATMYFDESPGNTGKRSLDSDDINGACDIYPVADDRDICNPPHCGLDLDGDSQSCKNPPPSGALEADSCGCSQIGADTGPAPFGSIRLIWRMIAGTSMDAF